MIHNCKSVADLASYLANFTAFRQLSQEGGGAGGGEMGRLRGGVGLKRQAESVNHKSWTGKRGRGEEEHDFMFVSSNKDVGCRFLWSCLTCVSCVILAEGAASECFGNGASSCCIAL